MKNIIVLIISVFAFTAGFSQEKSKGVVENTFKVEGVCDMCKERIENAALRTKGVKFAEWDKETKDLKVAYNASKVTEEEIEKAIAAAGHQTPNTTSDSTAYSNLPGCCKYKDGAKCGH